ncbi:MAG TPA: RNA helicase [Desulfomicrobium sp.]|nr:RNA helicase [Desulfomicrobium sp.]
MSAYSISWPELADLIGHEAATALCQHYGGLTKYVPADSKRGDLRKLIGQAAADTLASMHGGETLELPNRVNKPEPKKPQILRLLEGGLSVRQVAMQAGVTENWVKMLKRQHFKPRVSPSKGA